MDDLRYWLALHQALHQTPLTLKYLLEHFQTPKRILEYNTAQLPLTPTQKKQLRAIDWKHIEAEVRWSEHDNHHIMTIHHSHYPTCLKEIPDPPLVLYAIGNHEVLQTSQIAIVGSRKPSHAGQETARYFAHELSQAQHTITSGMALGIDSCAHHGALDAGRPTIAVLGCGVTTIYPKSHRHLYQQIQKHGLIVSEYPLNSKPIAEHFPQRNRIISGLSRATLVVEAALRSGSLITARLANEQGRDVFAIPNSIYNKQSRGCHYLIKQGAMLVESPQDILSELNLPQPLETQKNDSTYVKGLDQIDSNLIDCLGFETRSVQYLVSKCGIPPQHTAARLSKLELRGYIKAVPGGYCRVKL